jgi:hypothetical protein
MPILKDGESADPFGNTSKTKAQDRPPQSPEPRFVSDGEDEARAMAEDIAATRRKRQMATNTPPTLPTPGSSRLRNY